jgi:hypothetical protein
MQCGQWEYVRSIVCYVTWNNYPNVDCFSATFSVLIKITGVAMLMDGSDQTPSDWQPVTTINILHAFAHEQEQKEQATAS